MVYKAQNNNGKKVTFPLVVGEDAAELEVVRAGRVVGVPHGLCVGVLVTLIRVLDGESV